MKIVIEGKHIQDCENENRYYVELPDGWRIIFEDDEYAGCYYAGEEEKKPVVKPIGSGRYPWGCDKDDEALKKATEDIINDIVNNLTESQEIIDDLLKTRTKATEQKDGTTVVVTHEYPVKPLFLKDDPLSRYFDGCDEDWFRKHHYAHPKQCALLAKIYREYKEDEEFREAYQLCGNNACIDCILNDDHDMCTMKLGLGRVACGTYKTEDLRKRIRDIVIDDMMQQDKYGDYYDPRKWYAGKGGIVCAGDCYHVKNIRKENRREFNSLAEALTVGRCRECKHCHGVHKK